MILQRTFFIETGKNIIFHALFVYVTGYKAHQHADHSACQSTKLFEERETTQKTKSMTQTLDRFRLLRTCFLNISTAELQQANFSVVSESFFLLCISVNAHGNLYGISVCLYIAFFSSAQMFCY